VTDTPEQAAERMRLQAVLEETITAMLAMDNDGSDDGGEIASWVMPLTTQTVTEDGGIGTRYMVLTRSFQGWTQSIGLVEYARGRLERDLFG
jgi:hypothetical protein